MRWLSVLLTLLLAAGVSGWVGCAAPGTAQDPRQGTPERPKRVVLVELFTSLGCSSCPPADRLLSELGMPAGEGEEVEVVPLSYHVDYWNDLGWPDPFSAPDWSRRQSRYAAALGLGRRVYTPQVVIDGRLETVGSRRQEVRHMVRQAAAQAPAADLRARIHPGRDRWQVRVEADFLPLAAGPYDLFLVVFESGLETRIPRGENARRTLRNDFVVRRLISLGSMAEVTSEPWRAERTVHLQPEWRRDGLGAAVFLQHSKTLAVGAAAVARPAADGPLAAGAL